MSSRGVRLAVWAQLRGWYRLNRLIRRWWAARNWWLDIWYSTHHARHVLRLSAPPGDEDTVVEAVKHLTPARGLWQDGQVLIGYLKK